MSRPCMITDLATEQKCLGHPPVDDERYPAICDHHLDAIFGWLIKVKAQQLADQIVTERLMSRPRHDRQNARALANAGRPTNSLPTRNLAPMLKPGQHLTEQDNAVLAFLTGRAA